MTSRPITRRSLLVKAGSLSAAILASANLAGCNDSVAADNETARNLGDLHLTHGSPILENMPDKRVGVWIRLAPYKWMRAVKNVPLTFEVFSQKLGQVIAQEDLLAERDAAFILKFNYRYEEENDIHIAKTYFQSRLISEQEISV